MRKIKTKLNFPVFAGTTNAPGGLAMVGEPKSNLMTVKNLTDKSADLYIYGEIIDNTDWKWDEYDVMPEDVKSSLEKVDGLETLNIYINSPGGSVFAGLAIYNMLKRNEAKKIVHIDGIAASMASVIALVGDEVYMPSNAFMMIHKPLTIAIGNADDFRKVADDLDTIESGLFKTYEENLRDGIEMKQIEDRIKNESDVWLTADEATKYFNIEITGAVEVAASANHLLKEYKNVPKSLIEPKPKPKPQPQNKTDDELEKIKIQNELDLLSL